MAAVKRFVPLLDRVLVRKIEPQVKTAAGILLPDAAKQEIHEAVVLAAGPGRRDKQGDLMPMGVRVGDRIVLPKYGGTDIDVGDEELTVFRDEDILGTLE
eukprot:NODE_6422_length_507_cov_257.694690.p3 GENE.NODE_6422_length_507_cov_257.694690~~NODE_6422_length_507_cov_257.694690.p3  ORF type:complete len:100 (+),score=38.42 NODE_6422_length_507_cov_257.694690:76-375(+)